MEPSLIKLNLGCGWTPIEGYINIDVDPLKYADLVQDLNVVPWLFENNSVDEIHAQDCFEHLYPLGKAEGQMNIVALMRECHRVLKVGGLLDVIVPTTEGRGAWQDPTHVTYWNQNSFLYYVEGTVEHTILDPGFGFKMESCGHERLEEKGIVWCRAKLRKPKT